MQRVTGVPQMGWPGRKDKVPKVRRPTLKRLSPAQGHWLPFLDDDKRELDTIGGCQGQPATLGLRLDSREQDAARAEHARWAPRLAEAAMPMTMAAPK